MSKENFMEELKYINETAEINGFDEKEVKRIYKKQEKKMILRSTSSLVKKNEEDTNFNNIGIPFYGTLTENLKRRLKKFGIRTSFTNQGKLSDLFETMKDQDRKIESKSGIYMLECENCDACYVGQTKRSFETRGSEHLADCRKPLNPDSAMAYHCITEGHEIKKEMKCLKETDEPWKLNVWESLMLYKNRNLNLMNQVKEGNSPSVLYEAI